VHALVLRYNHVKCIYTRGEDQKSANMIRIYHQSAYQVICRRQWKTQTAHYGPHAAAQAHRRSSYHQADVHAWHAMLHARRSTWPPSYLASRSSDL